MFKLTGDGTEKVIYDFRSNSSPAFPTARLLRDQAGDLFGIASRIGSDNYGTAVFKISHGKETTLHFFGEGRSALGAPHAGVIADGAGNLYGVTCGGGAQDAGQVFKITPAGDTSILHEFTGSDGLCPSGELLADGQGNFYGTTFQGGDSNDGVVFKLASNGTETIIHSFAGTDGCQLWGGLLRDDAGNLYGTASYCGSGSGGTVYRISPNGKIKVLHVFRGFDGDGADPVGTLVRDTKGNLYGMTVDGGDGFPNTDGTVFRISAGGRETILHSFSGGDDDGLPIGGLAMDDAGNLYGSTSQGGARSAAARCSRSRDRTKRTLCPRM